MLTTCITKSIQYILLSKKLYLFFLLLFSVSTVKNCLVFFRKKHQEGVKIQPNSEMYIHVFISCTHLDNSFVDIYLMTLRDFNVEAVQLSIQWQPHAHTSEIHCQKKNVQNIYIVASQLKYLKKTFKGHGHDFG